MSVAELRFTRRDLLKGGGALIIGFSLFGPRAATAAPLGTPDQDLVDSWVAIHADNSATIFFGKCELGQGTTTGLLQIAGEELDMGLSQLKAMRLETGLTPNQGATFGSLGIDQGGPRLRAACAEARQALVARASERLGVSAASLAVTDGVVSVTGDASRSVRYGDLLGDKPFTLQVSGDAPRKRTADYTLVGTRATRVDLADKVTGTYEHMHHLRLPGMLHGRIVRPRGQSAYGTGAMALAIDEGSIAHISGARLIRKGDFIGVVAPREWDAVKAARDLKVTWRVTQDLPGNADLGNRLRAAKTDDKVMIDKGDLSRGFDGAAHTVEADYTMPYQSHGPVGPNCALADVKADGALVMCSTQDVYGSRTMLAAVLGMPLEKVRVQYHEGSGTFGHSGYEDSAQAAAILSQETGRPVRVQFMRWDEFGWDQFGAASYAEVRAAIDTNGTITAYEYDGWQHGWAIAENSQELAQQLKPQERTVSPSIYVSGVSTGGQYAIANRRVVHHHVPMLGLLRAAPLRSPMDLHYCFASEQVIDELAWRANMDPAEFRRRNIAGERWLGVLDAVVQAAGWTPRVAASSLSRAEIVTGRGIGIGTHFVSFGAATAEIEVNRKTGAIRVKKMCGAIDCGLAVNPSLVESQVRSQLFQAASRMLREEVTFSTSNVTSLDWKTYPVLRFADHPEVVPVVVQRINQLSTGAGEEVMGSAGVAIANAFFDATGKRLRQYPMTPERVRAVLASG